MKKLIRALLCTLLFCYVPGMIPRTYAQQPIEGILSIEGFDQTTEYLMEGSFLWWGWKPSALTDIRVEKNLFLYQYVNYLSFDSNKLSTVVWEQYRRWNWLTDEFRPVKAEYHQVYAPGSTNMLVVTNDAPRPSGPVQWSGPTIIGTQVTRSADVKYVRNAGVTITFSNNVFNGPLIYEFICQDQSGHVWSWYIRINHGQQVIQTFSAPNAADDSGKSVDWFRILNFHYFEGNQFQLSFFRNLP